MGAAARAWDAGSGRGSGRRASAAGDRAGGGECEDGGVLLCEGVGGRPAEGFAGAGGLDVGRDDGGGVAWGGESTRDRRAGRSGGRCDGGGACGSIDTRWSDGVA